MVLLPLYQIQDPEHVALDYLILDEEPSYDNLIYYPIQNQQQY